MAHMGPRGYAPGGTPPMVGVGAPRNVGVSSPPLSMSSMNMPVGAHGAGRGMPVGGRGVGPAVGGRGISPYGAPVVGSASAGRGFGPAGGMQGGIGGLMQQPVMSQPGVSPRIQPPHRQATPPAGYPPTQEMMGMMGKEAPDARVVGFSSADFPSLDQRMPAGATQGSSSLELNALRNTPDLLGRTMGGQHGDFSIHNEDFPALPGMAAGGGGFKEDGSMTSPRYGSAAVGGPGYPIGPNSGSIPARRPGQRDSGTPRDGFSRYEGEGDFGAGRGPGLGLSLAAAHSGDAEEGNDGVDMPTMYDGGDDPFGQHAMEQYNFTEKDNERNSERDADTHSETGSRTSEARHSELHDDTAPDKYGLLGLLSVIRMTDPNLNLLALGTDLTLLGLDLNAPESLYATFASPWAEQPSRREPEYALPLCYYMHPTMQPASMKTSLFSDETCFYIFYSMPNDALQVAAAAELYAREWRYHKELKLWFQRAGPAQTDQKGQYERGTYIVFDVSRFERVRKENYQLKLDQLDDRPPML